jgi:CheY-like chemotaxis protein/GGDEF domain-containing protein
MAEAQSSILIVDDDAEDLASVERTLRALGSELLSIRDPHEVMPGVHRHRPDVVILDALLPGLSGFDLCRQIKAEPKLKDTQVLILTGVYLRQQYRNEALQQFKADAFLTKPFRPPELQRLVVQLLARKTRLPRSSFLRRVGLSSNAEPKRRGLFGRLFGRSTEEEPATLRIAPARREVSPPPAPPPAAPVELASEIEVVSPPKEETRARPRKAKKSKNADPPEVVTELPPSEPPVPLPAVLAEDEPEKELPPPEPGVPEVPEPAAAVAEASPPLANDVGPELEVAAVEPPPPDPAPPEPASEEAAETPMAAEERGTVEDADEEPSPAALLDALPPIESEEVAWIDAESRTQDMTLEEAAVRAASSEDSEKLPSVSEELMEKTEEDEKEKGPTTRRPLSRHGEVPIYDEPDFLTEFKRELSKCRRVDRPLTLILIRVGDLGQIIELFGKDFRERVLWHIAEQAMESLREVDLVGMMSSKNRIALTAFASDRYGGGRIVSRLRQAVRRKPFRVGEELPPIIPALDFGMASFPVDGNEVSSLILRAEEDFAEGKSASLD